MSRACQRDRTQPRPCADCGQPFVATGRRGPIPCRCERCKGKRDYALGIGRASLEHRACVICGKPLPVKPACKVACSPRCAALRKSQVRRARSEQGRVLATDHEAPLPDDAR